MSILEKRCSKPNIQNRATPLSTYLSVSCSGFGRPNKMLYWVGWLETSIISPHPHKLFLAAWWVGIYSLRLFWFMKNDIQSHNRQRNFINAERSLCNFNRNIIWQFISFSYRISQRITAALTYLHVPVLISVAVHSNCSNVCRCKVSHLDSIRDSNYIALLVMTSANLACLAMTDLKQRDLLWVSNFSHGISEAGCTLRQQICLRMLFYLL